MERRTLSTLILVLVANLASARVVYVKPGATGNGSSWSSAAGDVQSAITSASKGDELWVAAGTYVGRYTLAEGVSLYGGFGGTESSRDQRSPKSNPTILDAAGYGSVVTAPVGITAATVLDGFTIRGGYGTQVQSIRGYPYAYYYLNGAGLYLRGSPTVSHNVITGNNCDHSQIIQYQPSGVDIIQGGWGGGIFVDSASPVIAFNEVYGNRGGYDGGGIATIGYTVVPGAPSGGPMITANYIHDNAVPAGTYWIDTYSDPYGYGGGLYCGSSATVANNIVAGNSAGRSGGGIYGGIPVNNILVGNSAGETGGGLAGFGSGTANNIVAFNATGVDASGFARDWFSDNDVFGNTKANYDGQSDLTRVNGNISADPLFANQATGDYHVTATSPVVDAGNTSALPATITTDADGKRRVQGSSVDMGAYETSGHEAPKSLYVVRVRPGGNDVGDGLSWTNAKASIRSALSAVTAAGGGEVWVGGGTYLERLTLGPSTALYGGFAGTESTRDQRNWRVNVTTINAQRNGCVITVPDGAGKCVVDGFTVMNGYVDQNGAGVYCGNCVLTLANDSYYNNSAVSGGAVAVSRGLLYVNGCIFGANTATQEGGGFYGSDAATIELTTSTFYQNTALKGGAAACETGTTGDLVRNVLTLNSANAAGGIYLHADSVNLNTNLITDNTASTNAALWVDDGLLNLVSNTICDNTSNAGGPTVVINGDEGANYFWSDDINNIIAFNSGGVQYNNFEYTFNNDYFGNADGNSNLHGSSDLSADPQFLDHVHGNYHLLSGSGVIDKGLDFSPTPIDLEGKPRNFGPHQDIGALEFITSGAYTVEDVVMALEIAGGLARSPTLYSVSFNHLDAVQDGWIDMADAVTMLRNVKGIGLNP